MRVLTYNIRGGLGMDGRRSTLRIADTIQALVPDLVCLQEVHQRLPQSRLVDQPARLAQHLQMSVTFQANLRFGSLAGYGIAIASRFPVVEVKRHPLPSVGEQRGALEVRLETPEFGALSVFCTHWGLNGNERVRQAATLATRIAAARIGAARIGAAPRPVIVCGDFNETSDSAAVRALREATGLRDADAERDRPTFPSGSATARIDFILFSDALRLDAIETAPSLASDHDPVWADFTIPSSGDAS